MRAIIYGVFNKETGKKVYTNCRQHKCVEYINTQENKNGFEIRYKWISV